LASIAYQTVDILRAMQNDSDIELQELRVDGGASRNDLLMQFQANVLGVPVVRPVITETTALGAAYLAGIAVGFWQSQDEVAAQWHKERTFDPSMSDQERNSRLDQWHRAVERARAWVE
jgi:glycerol kinase